MPMHRSLLAVNCSDMEVNRLKDMILILAVTAVFIFGFYIMKCVDRFLDENRTYYRCTDSDPKSQEPSFIMLTDDLPEDEIMKEIRNFKDKHEYTEIYLCDHTPENLSESSYDK